MLDFVESIEQHFILAMELLNFISLLWILLWTRRAGSRIVEAIAMRIGLRSGRGGKIPSVVDRLTQLADKYLPQQVGGSAEAPVEEKEIEIEGIGSFKPSEIQSLAKKYLPQVKKAAGFGDEGADVGVDIVKRLATGAPVGWQDALPWIMELLKPEAKGEQAERQSAGPSGAAWDS